MYVCSHIRQNFSSILSELLLSLHPHGLPWRQLSEWVHIVEVEALHYVILQGSTIDGLLIRIELSLIQLPQNHVTSHFIFGLTHSFMWNIYLRWLDREVILL